MNTDNKMSPAELKSALAHFTGTNDYYRSSMFTKSIVHTDGVKYLADKAGAYWLIDLIVSWQTKKRVRQEQFQVWTLKKERKPERKEDRIERERRGEPVPMQWVASATDGGKYGRDPERIARQVIPYSDFPLDEITIWMELGSLDGEHHCWIMMLPTER